MEIGYLGPRGTYSEEIALCLSKGRDARFIPYAGINQVIKAVEMGEVTESIVPVENSLEGSVNITLDTLAHEVDLYITREVIFPIHHNLLVKKGTNEIKVIVSHPQALAQCRHYLSQNYPQAELKEVGSTAEAAYLVAFGKKNYAAIGSQRAGEIYELELLAADIQDNPNNATRFLFLGKEPTNMQEPGGHTSLVCRIDGRRPGSLCEILQEFYSRNVNLTKIESRPARTNMGEYIFFFDLEGNLNEENVREAVMVIQERSLWFKNFGSYPSNKI